jgi:gamma-glutamyl hercynylcysteine S-oxide synthase
MDVDSSPVYSAAEALRSGAPGAVREALLAARARTLTLADAYAAALAPAGMRIAYQEIVNPPVWELGHVAWFQEYWIGRNRQRSLGIECDPEHLREPSLLPQADAFYNSSLVAHRARWELALPDKAQTRSYLTATLEQTLALLDRLANDAGSSDLYFFRLVALHEEMHAEAATYMARTLGIALEPQAPPPVLVNQGAEIEVPAQDFLLGRSGLGFAFDNELEAHPVRLEAFRIDREPVSWARFMKFVRARGYEQRRWWTDEGWAWVVQSGAKAPQPAAGEMAHAAIHLTAHEADAWCRWAGRPLPAEAEWECAAVSGPGFSWGQVWEWTASAFLPYPGFRAHPYRDYSAPWFGSRRVLRGASTATSHSIAHPRYRNFFEPQRSDVFTGFRSCA